MFLKPRTYFSQGNGSGNRPSGSKPALVLGGALVVAAGVAVALFSKGSNETKTPNDAAANVTTEKTTAQKDEGAPAQGSVTLQLWDQEEVENTKVIDTWIAKFTELHPNIKIMRQTYPNEELRTKYTMAATGGQAADLVWGPNDIAGGFTTAGLIQPVESLVDLPKFAPNALEAVRLKGKVMAVPATYGNHLVLMYNKSLVPTAPKTTDELIEVAKQFSKPEEKKYGFVMFQNEPFWLAPIIGGFGGWPLDVKADGTATITLNTPAVRDALAFIKDLKFKYQVIPPECDYDCAKGLFLDEKAPLHINGDWAVREYQAKLGDKLGIAPLPIVSATNKPMTPMVSGRYLFVNSALKTDRLEAAKEFINYLTSETVQVEVATRLQRIPVTLEAQSNPAVMGQSTVKEIMEAAANGRPMPAQNEMRAAWDAMRPVQQRVMAGDLDPDAAIAAMQQSALEKLASLKN